MNEHACRHCGTTDAGAFRFQPGSTTRLRRECRACVAVWRKWQVALASIGRQAPEPAREAGSARIYVVLSDVHVPYHDRRAVAGVCAYLADLRPHGLVFNGDILDLDEVSRHNAGSVANLEGKRLSRTWAEANRFLDEVISACGPRLDDIRWVDGNHEARIDRWLEQGDHAVFAGEGSFSIAERLRFSRRGVQHLPGYPDAHTTLGKLLVTHGTLTGKYAAARHLDKYRASVLFGHTHTPGVFYASGLVRSAAYNNGHLADVTSPAMSYAPTPNAWTQGFAVVHVRPSGEFQVQLINLWHGVFHVGDKQYGGAR